MGRSALWRRLAVAALIAGSLLLPGQADAAPAPVTIVATAESTYGTCWGGGGDWLDLDNNRLCHESVDLTATEGVGGTAVLTAPADSVRKTISLSCLSFSVTHGYPRDSAGVVPYTLRASGTADDGTVYYLVAEDFGPEGIGWYDDFTITTTPGDRACGTPSGWGNFFDTYVVTT